MTQTTNTNSNTPSNKNWYLVKDDSRNVTQIVIELSESGSVESEFGSLVLPNKFANLNTKKWTTGYFRIVSKPGPYLLVRADGYVNHLKSCPLRVAFSFCREPSAGIFAIFVSADSSNELQKASPTGHAVFECIFGLDDEDAVQRIKDGIALDKIHMCFAEAATNMQRISIGDYGSQKEENPPSCRFDRVFPVSEDCRIALIEEFKTLLTYHKSTRKNFQKGVQELSNDFPASKHPILEKSLQSNHSSYASQLLKKAEKKKW